MKASLSRSHRPLAPERQARKDALWAIHFHGAHFDPSMVPQRLRPMPLTDAIVAATRWDDEHACDRRVRSLRRLNSDFLSGAEKANTVEEAQGHLLRELDDHCAARYGRTFRTDLHSTRQLINQVRAELERPEHTRCIPLIDNPDFDPVRGQTSLRSELIVRRRLDAQLAILLDPRCWDNCSDLFDETYAVEERGAGEYAPPKRHTHPLGMDWKGLLYERAGVGPQIVENILRIDFRIERTCSGSAERTAQCEAGACHHDINAVHVDYGLYDSLSYQLGGIDFPGMMRQNHGIFRADSNPDGTTKITSEKTVRFGRITDWSAGFGGGFDYGDILNYLAPTYLSLWIYDVTVVVPCCNRIKKLNEQTGD